MAKSYARHTGWTEPDIVLDQASNIGGMMGCPIASRRIGRLRGLNQAVKRKGICDADSEPRAATAED
ncbi:hypothetical protein [Albidovulum aquaemixtae]|uniref:hypothetical protein n=1 Tax=Albidovulum aquaemixtae TaxID=1542388 RepID=UPI000D54BB5C|nr:hypothetical protein [Defluviimonas aquaemixtae]